MKRASFFQVVAMFLKLSYKPRTCIKKGTIKNHKTLHQQSPIKYPTNSFPVLVRFYIQIIPPLMSENSVGDQTSIEIVEIWNKTNRRR